MRIIFITHATSFSLHKDFGSRFDFIPNHWCNDYLRTLFKCLVTGPYKLILKHNYSSKLCYFWLINININKAKLLPHVQYYIKHCKVRQISENPIFNMHVLAWKLHSTLLYCIIVFCISLGILTKSRADHFTDWETHAEDSSEGYIVLERK